MWYPTQLTHWVNFLCNTLFQEDVLQYPKATEKKGQAEGQDHNANDVGQRPGLCTHAPVNTLGSRGDSDFCLLVFWYFDMLSSLMLFVVYLPLLYLLSE